MEYLRQKQQDIYHVLVCGKIHEIKALGIGLRHVTLDVDGS